MTGEIRRRYVDVDENGVSLEMLGHYPYRDTDPTARCHWWDHPAAVVQVVPGPDRNYRVERYTCECGRFTWWSDGPTTLRFGRRQKSGGMG